MQSLFAQKQIPFGIVRRALFVPTPINFNNQLFFIAVEIAHIRPDWVLPTELHVAELAVAQV